MELGIHNAEIFSFKLWNVVALGKLGSPQINTKMELLNLIEKYSEFSEFLF